MDLEEETRRDALTGVYNRSYLDQYLAREFEHSIRQHWPLSIAFADLDNFKAINDTYGHQAGDRILQSTARILRDNTRETDLISRYGGEEFVVVLPATDAETAHSICERIVGAFHEHDARDRRDHRRGSRSRSAARPTLRTTNLPTPPNSSRRPIKRSTRQRCADAIKPCPTIGNSRRNSPASFDARAPRTARRGPADNLTYVWSERLMFDAY